MNYNDRDVLEMTNNLRLKMPKLREEEEKRILYLKRNFLLIPHHILLKDTIESCQASLDIFNAIYAVLQSYYQKTNSQNALNQLEKYTALIKNQRAVIKTLEANGNRFPNERLVVTYILHLDNHAKIFGALLTVVELDYILSTT